jgi:hypothetical protein
MVRTRPGREELEMTDADDGSATLTDDEIETRRVGGPVVAHVDDAGDTGDDSGDPSDATDTGDDSGDPSDATDTGDDSGDTADTGDDATDETDAGDDSGDDS